MVTEKSHESPIFSIIPERSRTQDNMGSSIEASIVSEFSCRTNSSSKNNSSGNASVNSALNPLLSIVGASSIPPTATTAIETMTTKAIEKSRQLILLALLEKVCAMQDATPRTFAYHVLNLLEKHILDPESVRYLFDYHGFVPFSMARRSSQSDPPNFSRRSRENEVSIVPFQTNHRDGRHPNGNVPLSSISVQQERNYQLEILRGFFSMAGNNDGTSNASGTLNPYHDQQTTLFTSRYQREFDESSLLSSGSFGSVYLVENRMDGMEYAMKKIFFENGFDNKNLQAVLREVKCLAQLDHENCVRYSTSWLEPCWSWDYYKTNNSPQNNHMPLTEAIGQLTLNGANRHHDDESHSSLRLLSNHKKVINSNRYSFNGTSYDMNGFDNNGIDKNNEELGYDSEHSEWTEEASYSNRGLGSIDNNCFINSSNGSMGFLTFESNDSVKSNFLHTQNGTLKESRNKFASQTKNHERKERASPVFTYKICLYIQMQLCNSMTLADWIRKRNASQPSLSLKQRIEVVIPIMKQLASGLAHIHSKKIVHRDLKPANIMASRTDENSFKIGDFGLSKLCKSNDAFVVSVSQQPSSYWADEGKDRTDTNIEGEKMERYADAVEQNTTGVGTVSYTSPEQLNSSNYGPSSDIYSLGLIFLELISVFVTSHERAQGFRAVKEQRKVHLNEEEGFRGCSTTTTIIAWVKCFILRATDTDPNSRPSAENVREQLERRIAPKLKQETKVEQLESKLKEKEEVIETQKLRIKEMEETIFRLQEEVYRVKAKCEAG